METVGTPVTGYSLFGIGKATVSVFSMEKQVPDASILNPDSNRRRIADSCPVPSNVKHVGSLMVVPPGKKLVTNSIQIGQLIVPCTSSARLR